MTEVKLEGLMAAAKAIPSGERVTFKVIDAPDPDWIYTKAHELVFAGFAVAVEDAEQHEIEVWGR